MNALSEPLLEVEAAAALLTPQVIRAARARAAREQGSVCAALQDELSLSPELLLQALGRRMHLEVLDSVALSAMAPAFDAIGYADAARRGCLALREHGALVVVVSDPFDEALQVWCAERLAAPHMLRLAAADDIAAFLSRHEESMRAIDTALPARDNVQARSGELEDLSIRSIGEGTSVVVKLVHSTLYDALKSGVSDIHVESNLHGLVIKYRLDGTLTQVGSIEGRELAEQVLSRLKVMSELDIAERRVPQDGRFRVKALGREIDFRVSIMPSIHGEDAVVRVLDKQSLADQVSGLRLDVLGFDEATLAAFRRRSRDPYGLLLVTGPTGSGKTTTLYAALSEINHGHDKIITIEDPVEYQLHGVLQIPVNEKKGLTFARGLRSILRHDPDRIMVGEIRDPETAQIAIQAALTGHLVLSTVHANNVFDVIGRFTHMDVDPYSFVSALTAVLAQRLVRINCAHCSEAVSVSSASLREALIDPARTEGRVLKAGRGCGKCRGTGFKGRRAVGELLVLDDALRELIVARAPVRQIKEAAQRNGTRFLRDAALELFLDGLTTLDEVNRVTLVS
ncbi:MAG: general secretion pathway protein GspE [Burkholderiales bacterium PBB1]|nr:MAG: general secretion pathway protein GspE [Burkholderiales bacterium PBB1]